MLVHCYVRERRRPPAGAVFIRFLCSGHFAGPDRPAKYPVYGRHGSLLHTPRRADAQR
jgi:hypothetical protein